VKTSQTTLTAQPQVAAAQQAAGHDKVVWIFLLVGLLLFWVPEIIMARGWADFWIIFLTGAFIWSMFAVAFNLLMGYTGMVSFGQAAYLGIGGYTAGLLLKKIAGFPFALGLIAAPVGGGLGGVGHWLVLYPPHTHLLRHAYPGLRTNCLLHRL
jgi:branched-chain amino acid transport system permease protein